MLKLIFSVVFVVLLSGQGSEAGDCCGSYTDSSGYHHDAELCSDYCCFMIGVAYKGCCSDSSRQISASRNENKECVRAWLKYHIWVPIVGGIVGLIILIGICTCCCCCCCGCCRMNPAPMVIHSNAPPSTTVAMANTNIASNQYHAGQY